MSTKGLTKLIATVVAVFVILIGAMTFVEKVPEGKVSVVYSPSGGAKEVLNPGWHVVGLFDKTQDYPTRITIMKNNISVSTNDGKKITMPVSYEMKVDKSKVLNIFKELGSQNVEQIQEGYLYQRLFQSSRAVVSSYSVLDIYGTKTTEASLKVSEKMAETSAELGFVITNVTLGTPELDAVTQTAIDMRVQASQEMELKRQQVENEKLEAQKKAVIAQGEADKKLIEAKASADARILDANAIAESNAKINASLTDTILKKMELDARAKHGWVTIQGATPLVEAK